MAVASVKFPERNRFQDEGCGAGLHGLLVRPYPANNLTKFIVNSHLLRLALWCRPWPGPGSGATTGFEAGNHFMHRGTFSAGLAEHGIGAKRRGGVAAPADTALDLLHLASLVDVFVHLLLKLLANLRFAGGFFHGFGCRPGCQVAGFGQWASITFAAHQLTVSRKITATGEKKKPVLRHVLQY